MILIELKDMTEKWKPSWWNKQFIRRLCFANAASSDSFEGTFSLMVLVDSISNSRLSYSCSALKMHLFFLLLWVNSCADYFFFRAGKALSPGKGKFRIKTA